MAFFVELRILAAMPMPMPNELLLVEAIWSRCWSLCRGVAPLGVGVTAAEPAPKLFEGVSPFGCCTPRPRSAASAEASYVTKTGERLSVRCTLPPPPAAVEVPAPGATTPPRGRVPEVERMRIPLLIEAWP